MHGCAKSWSLFLSFNIVCHAMSCQQSRQQGKKLKKIWFLTISFRTSEIWSGQVNFFSLLVPGQVNFFNISTGLVVRFYFYFFIIVIFLHTSIIKIEKFRYFSGGR